MVEFHTPYTPQNLRLLEKKPAGCNPPLLSPQKINSLTHTLTSLTIAMEASSKAKGKTNGPVRGDVPHPGGRSKKLCQQLTISLPTYNISPSLDPLLGRGRRSRLISKLVLREGKSKLLSVNMKGENTPIFHQKLVPNCFFIK